MTGTILDMPPTALNRALVYGWLARLFIREPDVETLQAYSSPEWTSMLDDFATDPTLAPTVKKLRLCLDGNPGQAAMDLAVVFARLFYGVDGPKSVSPYESAHVSDSGLLFQESFEELNATLKQLGLSVSETFKEPADHLSVELAVMAELAERGDRTGLEGERDRLVEFCKMQLSFLDEHLLTWLPKFCKECHAREPESLYAKAAKSALDFVQNDREWLRSGLAYLKKNK